MNAYDKLRDLIKLATGGRPSQIEAGQDALAALAELERAAAEPVAWMWNNMLGIPQVYASQKRPTWPDAGSSPAMAVAINVRPLYTAPPPAPVAEIERKDYALTTIIQLAERRPDCADILTIARTARLPAKDRP